ncbi:MAG: ATP-binding protein [Peptostreptococcaceae bacterium]
MKWNKFFKKSIFSKLFLMNIIILVCIVLSQLFFQSVYFEKYYIGKKNNISEGYIKEFQQLLEENPVKEQLMEFINKVKKKDNVILSFRNLNLSDGISLQSYMGSKYIEVNDINNNKIKVIVGDQFPTLNIKKGDSIEVYGDADGYGYVLADKILINNVEIQPYYEIIPNKTVESIVEPAIIQPSIGKTTEQKTVGLKGYVNEIVNEDNTYKIYANEDLYIGQNDRTNILNNNKYSSKASSINGVGEILINTQKLKDGYIIAITPLSEVNEVIGTMNDYYFIVFFIVSILVIIISFIYSKIMSKPLVEMSNIATKISQRDFKYKYKVNSEDEIGVLGSSLNLISENLEKSLTDLEDTNIKLKSEMENHKIQEEKRKELIANISHELKTPITIIQGSINCIKQGMDTVNIYEDILEETEKMNDLVKEMLEISKLESPTFKLNNAPFDLCSVFLKEYDKMKSIINEKQLTLSYEIEDEVVVLGDEKRINQVVSNLLTNAIKYTPKGERINVSIEEFIKEDEYVFCIENFGVSLSSDEMDNIWDAFYRTEKSRNKKFGGSGLGLSIVKRILEMHKSNYGVESIDDSVKFYFTLEKYEDY